MTDILVNPDGSIAMQNGHAILLDETNRAAMEECCCSSPPPGYVLRSCYVPCGEASCSSRSHYFYTTPELSPTLKPSDVGKSVKVAGSDRCWSVYATTWTGSDVVTVTGRYSGCSSGSNPCCDDCMHCNEAVFSEDATISGYGMNVTCRYDQSNFVGLRQVNVEEFWYGPHVKMPYQEEEPYYKSCTLFTGSYSYRNRCYCRYDGGSGIICPTYDNPDVNAPVHTETNQSHDDHWIFWYCDENPYWAGLSVNSTLGVDGGVYRNTVEYPSIGYDRYECDLIYVTYRERSKKVHYYLELTVDNDCGNPLP